MANVNPSQPAPQPGPQPDLARLRQVFQPAATEFGNFANLPPFAQGNALMQQMQQLQQQMQQLQQQMQQLHQEVQRQTQQSQQFQQQMLQQMNQNFTAIRNDIKTNHQATSVNTIRCFTSLLTGYNHTVNTIPLYVFKTLLLERRTTVSQHSVILRRIPTFLDSLLHHFSLRI